MKLTGESVELATAEQATNCDELSAAISAEAFNLIPVNNHTSVPETALGVCKEILEIIPKVTNTSILRSSTNKMKAILSLLRVNSDSESPQPAMNPIKRYSPNARNQKQLRFYKTRRTNTRLNSRWAKPSLHQEQDICTELLSQEITICGVCHKEDEEAEEESEQYNYWTCCSKCDIWIHSNCTVRL